MLILYFHFHNQFRIASNLNREKRETQFPKKLWPDNRSIVKESTEIEKPNEKLVQNNYAYRLGVPIIPTENINSSSTVKVESPAQYHLSYNINQAGPGVIGLKDTENLPTYFLKQYSIQNTHAFRRLQSIIHQNLVYLIEGFQSGGKFYIVYEYHHLAISLSYIATNVRFSEADIATIYKEILRGVIFIHYELKTSCPLLDCSNILLISKGEVKIGMGLNEYDDQL